uniref:NADH dehydrogenase subunit 6 n=1 Tax=Hypnea marchantiae TaxID=3024792 RepID=UPI0030038D94|nr:NADH dehydrogenase subunit 6 [Hypnea marchantiae]
MNLNLFLFILFAVLTAISSFMVITSLNAVHSVLFLILVFCNTSALLLLLGSEFLSLMLIIVYVGAIAVLFLFVVMMLNVKINPLKISNYSIIPIGFLIFSILFNILSSSMRELDLVNSQYDNIDLISWVSETNYVNNIETIGNVLYTNYCALFLICGIILLVAMVGVIVLTMHQRRDVKKQKIEIQLCRVPSNVVKFVNLRI